MDGESRRKIARRTTVRQSKFSGTQNVWILKEREAGMPVKDVYRKYRISSACR